jgi:hypothetical protein
MHAYDLQRHEWSEIHYNTESDVPQERWSHSSIMLKSKGEMEDLLVVMLGSSQHYFSDCQIYDFGTNEWSKAQFDPPLDAQNSATCAITMDSKVLLFGGRKNSDYINYITELTFEDVVPLSMFYSRGISRDLFTELYKKDFTFDVDIICQSIE